MTEDDELQDPSRLKDHDWVEVNKLRNARKEGGDALARAWGELFHKDLAQFTRVAFALIPDHQQDVMSALPPKADIAKRRWYVR